MGPEALGAVSVIGGLTEGLTQISGGEAEREAGRRANEQALINVEILEALGVRAGDDVRRQSRRVASTRRVAFAKGGVNPNTGSALDVALDAAVEDELAALDAKFGLDSRAFQEKVRGANAILTGNIRAETIEAQGRSTIISGLTRGVSTAALFPKEANFTPGSTRVLPATGGPLSTSSSNLTRIG